MKQASRQARQEGRSVGFVPTMGALHEGHLSLVRAARAECQSVVVSIFVNPAQFAPNEDLRKYPRTFEEDCKKLEAEGVDFLFAPEASEMYPPGFCTWVDVEGLSGRLDGKSRPGHFRGVTTVVLKLLQIVQPEKAYFGRKDAQQARLIRQMARDLNLDPEIVVCPIAREAGGLAMSSRNTYLTPEERAAATVLFRGLDHARQMIEQGERTPCGSQQPFGKRFGPSGSRNSIMRKWWMRTRSNPSLACRDRALRWSPRASAQRG